MFIKCKVVGKQRPRFRRVGNYVQTYTPKETKELEEKIRAAYEGGLFGGACEVVITAQIEPAKSLSQKRRQELIDGLYCEKKPDIDNIAKLVLDGLNGKAFLDDKQVASLKVLKMWSEEEGLRIDVYKANI